MNLYYNWQLHQSMHNYKSIAILISNVRFIACVQCMGVRCVYLYVCVSVLCTIMCWAAIKVANSAQIGKQTN